MPKHFLFLSPRYSADSRIMADAARAAGWNVVRLPAWQIPDGDFDGLRLVYGETLFARFIAENMQLRLNDPPHDFLPSLPDEMRRREVQLMSVANARKITERKFIKPVDDKTFRAQLMNSGAGIPEYLRDDEWLLVSEPVEWLVEYRFFILDGKVQTGSVYCRNGELDDTSGDDEEQMLAGKLAEAAAQTLPGGVVVDTGFIRDRGWAVVEANPAWGSGLYACNPADVLRVLEAACFPL